MPNHGESKVLSTTMKPLHVYLDTNAFRYFGIAFEKTQLSPDVREKVLISPLSAFEVFAQLGDDNKAQAELVLGQIHALHNWTNSKHAKGIKSKVVKSEQASRIVVATPEDLSDAKKAEAVLKSVLGL